MSNRNAPQTSAYQKYLRACEHRDQVRRTEGATLEQINNAELDVSQAYRYMINATTLKKGENVGTAFNRTYPELS